MKFESIGYKFITHNILEKIAKIFFLIFLAIIIFNAIKLLKYIEWGDESETIVASKMIASGSELYSSVFNMHGPLTFLPGVLLELCGSFGISGHRTLVLVFQIFSLCLLYKSSLIKSYCIKRLFFLTSLTFLFFYMPDYFSHMYKYQVWAGMFILIILSRYTLPSLLACSIKTSDIIFSSFLISCLPFLAINYLIIALCLIAASYRKEDKKFLIYGLLSGIVFNLIVIASYASFYGYFAIHIYMNSFILPFYDGGHGIFILIKNVMKNSTLNMEFFLFLMIYILSFMTLASKSNSYFKIIILLIGVFSLLLRGPGFHAIPYLYAIIPFSALLFSKIENDSIEEKTKFFNGLFIFFSLLILLKFLVFIKDEEGKFAAKKIVKKTEFSEIVKGLTFSTDKILVYSFQNFQYIASNRLPSSGQYFYLPWVDDFNKSVIFKLKANACSDMKTNPPKLILLDKWKVWDAYPWSDYGSCIQQVVADQYVNIPETNYYLRKSILADKIDYLVARSDLFKKTTQKPLLNAKNFEFFLGNRVIKRVGIMLAVNHTNHAETKITIITDKGFIVRHLKIKGNADKYYYIDLGQDQKLRSLTISPVSGSEVQFRENDRNELCTNLVSESQLTFTSGCSIY